MASQVSLEALRYVQAVVETGSFSAAARAYGVTQPALSNGIAKAEERLGGQLFERSPRGVTLTAFGEQLVPYVTNALASIDRVTAEAGRLSERKTSSIKMGVSPLIDPRLIAAAYNASRSLPEENGPRELVLREANMQELQDSLQSGELDIILIPSVAPLPRFTHRIIDSEPVVLVCGSGENASTENAREEASINVGDIGTEPLILVPDACGLTTFTKDLFSTRGVAYNTYSGEASSYRVLEQWANLGLGMAILPESKVTAGNHGVMALQEDGHEVEIFYEAVWDPASALANTLGQLADRITSSS
ncbi:LysR family transcriptional regulator [Corynebacterium sp. S7]